MIRYFATLDLTTVHPSQAGYYLVTSVRSTQNDYSGLPNFREIDGATYQRLLLSRSWEDGYPSEAWLDPDTLDSVQSVDDRAVVRFMRDGVELERLDVALGESGGLLALVVQKLKPNGQVDRSFSGQLVLHAEDRPGGDVAVLMTNGEANVPILTTALTRWRFWRSDTIRLHRPAGAAREDFLITVE